MMLARMTIASVASLRRFAAALAEQHRLHRRRRAAAATLHTFSDHMLKDIGVARCEIERVVADDRPRAA